MSATAFPLAWPAHVQRTAPNSRKRAKFRQEGRALTIAAALRRLQDEVGRLKDEGGWSVRGTVISSNVELRNDGLPRSGARPPDDPAVAVYFYLGGKHFCLPCDRWDRVADNLAAVAGHINATRAIERYGVGSVEQAFTGFAAIEPPSWWRDLGMQAKPATLSEAEAAWRRFIKEHHPDLGGDKDLAARANQAIADARREMS